MKQPEEPGRIVGGKDAPYPIPWQASIGSCGATILDAKTLLSAAHCFASSVWVIRNDFEN